MSAVIARFNKMEIDHTQMKVLEAIIRRDRSELTDARVKREADVLSNMIQNADFRYHHTATFLCDAAASDYAPIAVWAKNLIEVLALVTPGSVRPLIKVG